MVPYSGSVQLMHLIDKVECRLKIKLEKVVMPWEQWSHGAVLASDRRNCGSAIMGDPKLSNRFSL